MGAVFNSRYAPNPLEVKEANAVTTWIVLASDGVGYASLALLAAAGKKPYPWAYGSTPGLDQGSGMWLQTLTLLAEGAAGAAGSAFYYAVDRATQPANDLPGVLVVAATTVEIIGPLWNLWIRKTVGTDDVNLYGKY
jgi:hypothetical protein